MRKYIFIISILLFASCNRKTPQIIYQDKIVTKHDTINVSSKVTDTIPCDDFEIFIENEIRDTVYLKVVNGVITASYRNKDSIIYSTPIINNPRPRKQINNINSNNKGTQIGSDNVNNKTKKGDNVNGDGNTITKPVTKKNNWWWIFLAGMLTWFIIQNVLFRVLKTYIPILKFLP